MKKIQIEGIFFDDLSGIFSIDLDDIAKKNNLTREEVAARIKEKAPDIFTKMEAVIAEFYIRNNKFNLEKFISATHANQSRIIKANKASFQHFILYINGCVVLYESATEIVHRKKLPSTITMCLCLYGLILRRCQQIVTMLMDGYIDGAMMIWRSMYEYSITLMVLAFEDNSDLADRYFQHSLRNQKKKVTSYHNNYKALKFKPLPKKTNIILASEETKLQGRFGKEFLENEFGWGDIIFPGKQKANLRNLEEMAGFSRYRPYYIMCSEHTHSNFNGFKDYMIGNKVILPRLLKQEYEKTAFVDPMQFTISILDHVTDYILYTFSVPHEYSINKKLLMQIFERMQKTFRTKSVKK